MYSDKYLSTCVKTTDHVYLYLYLYLSPFTASHPSYRKVPDLRRWSRVYLNPYHLYRKVSPVVLSHGA